MDQIPASSQPPRFNWILIPGIILAILALTVPVLNYFNIFSLSLIYPKQLGWLPHQPLPEQTVQPPLSPAPTSTSFNNQETVARLLNSLITSSIKLPYQPKTISLKPGLTEQSPTSEGSFHSNWNYQEATGVALLTLTKDFQNFDIIRVGFLIPKHIPLTPTTVVSIISPYFSLTPQGIWYCQSSMNGLRGTYCENFWTIADGTKNALYIRSPSMDNATTSTLVLCQIFPSSALYSWKSCNPEFAKEGMK